MPKPFLTLFFQIVGMMIFSLNSIRKLPCDYFFDTQGFPYAFFIVKYFLPECKVGTYVHYPFMSEGNIRKLELMEFM